MEWLDRQWNEPNRTDRYLMQIAREIAYTHRDAGKVGEMKLEFSKQPVEVEQPMTREEAAATARARWGGIVNKDVKHDRS